MEQKVMEQIDKAYEIYAEKGAALSQRYETLKKEIFTDEIREMIKLLHSYGIDTMKLNRNDNSEHAYYRYITFCKHNVYTDEYSYGPWINDSLYPCVPHYSKSYSPGFIRCLETGIAELKESTTIMNFLENEAKNLVEHIATKYKEKTEEETDRLANILSELDYEDDPIKHIKVTVEWI